MNIFNKRIIDNLNENRFMIILNSEDTDIHNSYALYILEYINNPDNYGKTIVFLSPYQNDLDLVRGYITKFDNITKDMVKSTHFDNNIIIRYVRMHKHSVMIGYTADMIIGMNVAFADNNVFVNFNRAIYPVMASSKYSKLIYSSHPNGMNHFQKMFSDAEKGIGSFESMRMYFWEDKNCDSSYISNKIQKIGEDDFNQYYNLVFENKKRK